MKNIFKPKTRAYLYSVVGASVPLLVTIGLLTGEVAGHVSTIAAAILAVGGSALAYSNTDKD